MKMLNPEFKPHRALVADDATWDALKATVTAYLQTKAAEATVTVADLRALDSQLDDDLIWAQLAGDMGLIALPDPAPPEPPE